MPVYRYHCPANGYSVTVEHGMDEGFSTWSEQPAAAAPPALTPTSLRKSRRVRWGMRGPGIPSSGRRSSLATPRSRDDS